MLTKIGGGIAAKRILILADRTGNEGGQTRITASPICHYYAFDPINVRHVRASQRWAVNVRLSALSERLLLAHSIR